MKPTFLFLVSIRFLFIHSHQLQAQTNAEKAIAKGQAAIKLVDEGQYAEGIKLLEEAKKLDEQNIIYPYEIAYAYYLQKNYKKAIKCVVPLTKQKNADEKVYQLAGNSYDFMGDKEKALCMYDQGLERFPSSGGLHLERGNLALIKEDYEGALAYYEKGIEADPQFASNYYWAARIYCSSTEKVWGMIYGEIFINLERKSKRTGEISRLLFGTYKESIKFSSDTSMSVSFSKRHALNAEEVKKGMFKLPFGTMVYEKTLAMAAAREKQIDLSSLDRIRTNFTDFYFQDKNAEEYPNVLFDYQQKILKAGHMTAYNYWLLGKGEEARFSKWRTDNQAAWDAFVDWFNENKLTLNEGHKFYRKQY